MGTPVYVLIGTVTSDDFVGCAQQVPSVRYVSTTSGAERAIVVLDLARPTDLDPALHALIGCGAMASTMRTLRPVTRPPYQLKFAEPDTNAAFIAVKVNNMGEVPAVRSDIKSVPGVNAAEMVAGSTDVFVEVQGRNDQAVHATVRAVVAKVGDRGRTRTAYVANKFWRGPPAGRSSG